MLQNAYGLFELKNHIQRGNIEKNKIYLRVISLLIVNEF